MPTLRIFIVDDHSFFRSAIRTLLDAHRDWKVCGEASDGIEAIEKASNLKPDVVLLDLSMPRLDGLTAIELIHRECPKSHIVILTQTIPLQWPEWPRTAARRRSSQNLSFPRT